MDGEGHLSPVRIVLGHDFTEQHSELVDRDGNPRTGMRRDVIGEGLESLESVAEAVAVVEALGLRGHDAALLSTQEMTSERR